MNNLSLKEYRMTPYLETLIEEARKERKTKRKPEYFSNAEDMIKSLNS